MGSRTSPARMGNEMSLTIVDTDILIDFAAEDERAARCLKQREQVSTLAVSAITVMELMVGCRNKSELRKTERLLERFEVIALNEQASATATELIREYRLSHGLLIPDALVAATALAANCDFVTKNQRDYRFIEGLKLLAYPTQ